MEKITLTLTCLGLGLAFTVLTIRQIRLSLNRTPLER
jgi:hypothetical protein